MSNRSFGELIRGRILPFNKIFETEIRCLLLFQEFLLLYLCMRSDIVESDLHGIDYGYEAHDVSTYFC